MKMKWVSDLFNLPSSDGLVFSVHTEVLERRISCSNNGLYLFCDCKFKFTVIIIVIITITGPNVPP